MAPRARDVTVNLRRVGDYIPPAQRQALLQQLGLLVIGKNKRRTKQGLDVEGKEFKPYSSAYADLRRRAGWQTSPPDLWLRGGMLGGLALLDVSPDRVLIGFQGSSARAVFVPRARARKHRKTGTKLDLTLKETGERVANGLKAYWNQTGGKGRPPRRFFGLSAGERQELLRYALRELLRIVGQVNLHRAAGRK